MRRRVPAEQLLFDPEIEKTARKNNSKTKKIKQQNKQKQQKGETSNSNLTSSPIQEETMAEETTIPTNTRTQGTFTHSSPRTITKLARTTPGLKVTEMKTGLLQLLYANPFAGLDHEDPYAHLIKFYELCGIVGAADDEEEMIFLRLFPFSLIGKAKDWFLNQTQQTMSNWN